jgi:serine/threonine-protein kinase
MSFLKVGDRIGPYEIVEEIGRGGMAVVYRARQASLARFVALKVLAPALAGNPDFVSRFHREATIAASLEHPHIVPIFDVGEADGIPYIAMRYLAGPSLAQLIRQEGPFSFERAGGLLEQVASALDFAHARGVVHRDVKPGNVLVEAGDRVSLVDFGIAWSPDAGALTRTGVVLGTPRYMAPEHLQRREVDYRADLYALGILATELLVGSGPFDTDASAPGAAEQLLRSVPLPALRADLPSGVDPVIRRMVALEPIERYSTAADFVAALRAELPGSGPARPSATAAPLDRGTAISPVLVTPGATSSTRAERPDRPESRKQRRARSWRPAAGVGAILVSLVALAVMLQVHPLVNAAERPTATNAAGEWWVFGGPGSGPGQFQSPSGIAVDAVGNMYVADAGHNRVQKLSPTGQPLAQWGQEGSGPGEFHDPSGVAVDRQGNVYVADSDNQRVQKLSPTGQSLSRWGTRGSGPGQYLNVTGVAVDGPGNIFTADLNNQRIQHLLPTGQFVDQWGHAGSAPGQFAFPFGVAVDHHGIVYVADQGNNRIQCFSPSGQPLFEIGSEGKAAGQLLNPTGVAVDGAGNIYVADLGNQRVQKLSPSGEPLAQWGEPGSGAGHFRDPVSVAVDESGDVYVADRGNNRIQKLAPSGSSG